MAESIPVDEGMLPESNAERHARLIEAIYRSALAEHGEFKEVPAEEMRSLIGTVLSEMEELEAAADPKNALAAITPEIANSITALWDFSGPGTYDDPVKEDRYKDKSWARGMDRARLNYAAWLVRKITEMRDPGIAQKGPIDEAAERSNRARQSIREVGPTLIYNGTSEENAVVVDVLTREGIIIPSEKAHVMGEGIKNTVDQIKTFSLPENLHEPGKEIGLISHAPHLIRVAHMLNRYQSIPPDMDIRFFPIKTPEDGREEYTAMEIRGILYYIYLSKNHDAAKEPYPYIVHGKQKKDEDELGV